MTLTTEYAKRVSTVVAAYGDLLGAKIKMVRPLTAAELEDLGWYDNPGTVPLVLVLDNGKCLVPSMDAEGNGPGHLFVETLVTA
jgi:hypothetical protein